MFTGAAPAFFEISGGTAHGGHTLPATMRRVGFSVSDRQERQERVDVEAFDRVIKRIFGCGLALAAVLNRPDVDDEVTERLSHVLEELDLVVADIRRTAFAPVVLNPRRARLLITRSDAESLSDRVTFASTESPRPTTKLCIPAKLEEGGALDGEGAWSHDR